MKHIKTHNEFVGEHVIVEYELFTLCDKSCSYCYNVVDTNGERYNNTIDNVLEGLKRIMEMDNKKIVLELIGGEPLLHKNFEQIINYMWENKHPDHKFAILTHADHQQKFFQERLGLFKKFGDSVRITCTLHTEELNRQRFLENIKWVNDNFKYCNLFFFTDNKYLEDFDYIQQVFDSLTTMRLQPLVLDQSNPFERAHQLVNMAQRFSQYEHLMDVQYEIDGITVPYNKAKVEMFKFNKLIYKSNQCTIRAYEVDRDGHVSMCCFQNNETPLGNIFTDPSKTQLDRKVITCQQPRCQMNIINFEVSIDEKRTT